MSLVSSRQTIGPREHEADEVRVLLIHQAFVSPNEPGGTRHYELGQRLVSAGHTLTIVASRISYLTGTAHQGPKVEHLGGIQVRRAWVPAVLHKSFLWRVAAFLIFMVSSVITALRSGRCDLVMGTSPPLFQALSAWLVAKVFRAPFLLEIRDLWPEFAIGMGVLKNPILIAVARFIERFLYRHADAIVVNSPAYRDYLIEHGIAAQKIYFVPNGVDAKAFSQADDEAALALRDQLGISEKFVVTYAGALGLANDLGTVLDTAMKLTDRDDIHFLIVGDGKEAANLKERAKSQGLTNVTFTGSLPKSKMPAVLAASDACLAILQNIPMFQMTYPNKVFDYMAAGKPTLLAIDGVIREVMEQADGGIFVPPQNPDALAKATVRLANSPELCKRMGKTASAYVRNHFNRDQQAIEFKRVVESLDRRKTANSISQGPITEEQRNAA